MKRALRYPIVFIVTGLIIIIITCCNRRTGDTWVVDYKTLAESFREPPDTAKPGVYWYFMDGNLSRGEMTADLESMQEAGIGNLVFLEVNVDVPRGPVDFLSDEWQELFVHAVREAERLGIEITMGVGPGWTGSGGPWVKPEESMRHLVSSSTTVEGPGECDIQLPVPPPHPPIFGENSLGTEMKKRWLEYYEDVIVLAFPAPSDTTRIKDITEKALVYRSPYSSQEGVKPFLQAQAEYPDVPAGAIIPEQEVINVTAYMQDDGRFTWEVPEGNWTIMRFGLRNNGAVTRPAPRPGIGFECDKFSATAFNHHFDNFLGKLIEKTGRPGPGSNRGWTFIHMDSWEMGAQNWTEGFMDEFMKRRGYDPLPWLPAYDGKIVGSPDQTERFLWDMRITSQELVMENHVGRIKDISREYGFGLSIEPYDMNPTADLDLGSPADVPMCEFWSKGYGFNTTYSVFESGSIAHIHGRPVLAAEAFTALSNEAWKMYPGSMKNQGDWAFCAGINRFVYHTFVHKSLGDSLRPGMTMGPYGVHWDRGQTWWTMVGEYHRYITRCQYMLQQGQYIADVLYLTPEGAPHIFRPPESALSGSDSIPDRRGYNFDGISPLMLMNMAKVKDGKIVFPGGASYHILVMPIYDTMTPELLQKIKSLAKQGAVIVGGPPVKSPSLVNYPECDSIVYNLSKEIWGGFEPPSEVTKISCGKGSITWGGSLSEEIQGELYPHYEATAYVLKEMGVQEDFRSEGPVRYTHRRNGEMDIYFISNTSDELINTNCTFRVRKGVPELWDPLTGEIRPLPEYHHHDGMTTIPVKLDAYQGYFVVFTGRGKRAAEQAERSNFSAEKTILELEGPWTVSFDTAWGGPAEVVFDSLVDWTSRPEGGIRYYSGIASYHKSFELPEIPEGPVYIDLGKVNHIARVILNGKDMGVAWCAPWQLDLSGAIQEGTNHLEIQVANLWVNRLIGDEVDPEARYTYTTYRYYTRESELVSSGLMGPIRIRAMRDER